MIFEKEKAPITI